MNGGPQRLQSVNPATLRPLGHVPVAGPEDVARAVDLARSAQPGWAGVAPPVRGFVLEQAARLVAEQAGELASLVAAESGKTRYEALGAEVLALAEALRWLGRHAASELAPRRHRHAVPLYWAKKARLLFEPLGVVAIITPWNYPLAIPGVQAAFALAAGNSVVCKPSDLTPLAAERLRAIYVEAGVPPSCFQLVHGSGQVGRMLTDQGPARLVFTGSVATGRAVAQSCAAQGVPVTLELGGNDPMIVRADAKLRHAVDGAVFGGYFNAGQTCAAVERIYVHEKVAEQFLEKLVAKAARLRVGDPLAATSDVGPMIHERHRMAVQSQVDDALRRGARLLTGGPVQVPGCAGAFYAPAVVAGAADDSDLMRTETFGPVLAVRVVASDDEAVALSNGTGYGLTASVWTADVAAGARIAAQLQAGTVYVNDVLYSFVTPDAPWGGVKASGIGRTHSVFGLHEMVSVKLVSSQPSWLPALGYPPSRHWYPALRSLLRARYGPRPRAASLARAAWSFLRALAGR